MRLDFVGASPPGLIASSSSATSEDNINSHDGNFSSSLCIASPELWSEVCCESTVRISSNIGSLDTC